MQKITDFIVEKRLWIFIIFIILTILAVFSTKFTKINYDIMEYLPKSSDVRKGLDIMEDNFDDEMSSLDIMLKDLSDEDKTKSLEYLKNLKYVDEVEYEDNEYYNKDNYTLYVLNLDYDLLLKKPNKYTPK